MGRERLEKIRFLLSGLPIGLSSWMTFCYKKAIIRRFNKRLYIPLPNLEGRVKLIKNIVLTKESDLFDMNEEDIQLIAERTEGYSGSDLTEMCREASMCVIRKISDFEAIDANDMPKSTINDFKEAMLAVKPSVPEQSLNVFIDWAAKFGNVG